MPTRRKRPGTFGTFRSVVGNRNRRLHGLGAPRPPPGLDSVTIKAFPHNYISPLTVVDFDAVEKWKPSTIPGILRPVLSDKKSIWVDDFVAP
jgi:hypothetical protein